MDGMNREVQDVYLRAQRVLCLHEVLQQPAADGQYISAGNLCMHGDFWIQIHLIKLNQEYLLFWLFLRSNVWYSAYIYRYRELCDCVAKLLRIFIGILLFSSKIKLKIQE